MTRRRGRRALLLLALTASFSAGVIVDRWMRTSSEPKPVQTSGVPYPTPADRMAAEAPPPVSLPATLASQLPIADAPVPSTENLAATPLPVEYLALPAGQPTMTAVFIVGTGTQSTRPRRVDTPARPSGRLNVAAAPAASAGTLSVTTLRMPIDGISIESFKGGFSEARGSRLHEAVDMVVPRGTPIHAVRDGTIAKLFFSKAGGITIYQFDPDGRICYYYAHLDRYADGLHEGQRISQGEVIGYVGSSGNARPDAPHLHFAIFELDADRKWWHGRPLDPYLVFKEQGVN